MSFGEYIPKDYGQPVNYLQDAMLSGQVQTALQERFDVNSAKLEEVVKKVTSVPILQEDAKRYLGEKVQGALSIVQGNLKASRGQGLLSNSMTTQLQGYITDAIDDKVKDHIRYSQQIQNFENGVAKLKQKDPKSYNQDNYEFAKYMAGYNEYLNGNVDTKLGSLQYIPNKDVWGDASKKIDDLIKAKGDMTVDVIDPNDPSGKTIIKKNIKGLSRDEIIKYMPNLLDGQDKQQLMINGWSDLKHLSKEQVGKRFDDFISFKKGINDAEIKKIDDILSEKRNSLSAKDIQEYEAQKKVLSDSKDWISKQASEIDKTRPEQVGYLLQKESFLQNVSDAFKRQGISYEYKVNPVHEYEEKLRKEQRDYELDLVKDAREEKKYQLDLLKAQGEGTVSMDASGNPTVPGLKGAAVDSETEQQLGDLSDADYVKKYDDEYKKMYDEVYKGARNIVNKIQNVDSEAFNKVDNYMKAHGYTSNKEGTDYVDDPNYKGKKVSKADVYVKALIEAGVPEKHSQLAGEIAGLVQVNEGRADLARTMTKAKQAGNVRIADANEGLTNARQVALGGEPVYNIKKGALLGDFSKARKVLEDSNLKPFVSDAKTITIPPSKDSLLLSIDPTIVSGGTFDEKAPYSIKKDEGGDLIISQMKNGKAGELPILVSAKIKQNSDVGKRIGQLIGEQQSLANELDVKRVPNGYTIGAIRGNTIVSDGDAGTLYPKIKGSIDATIKDTQLADELRELSLQSLAEDKITIGFRRKGYDEATASRLAEILVDKVNKQELKGSIQKNEDEWTFSLKNKAGIALNGYSRVGNTSVVSTDISNAMRMYGAQTSLKYLLEYINDSRTTNKDIERILKSL